MTRRRRPAPAERRRIQTPYRYFPVKPHRSFPVSRSRPVVVRAEIRPEWPLIHAPTPDRNSAPDIALEIELLSVPEIRRHFPHSRLYFERLAGLVKSITAVEAE
ncbi:hypothetical protein [Microtetraspora fusca]|uniref:hypothetical protein n=1 Tax=Microtetraspora fusca TaxID=1997 RepID=UPI000B18AFD9|nr:hypothetical protein [Microtetraspora fusca]